jgi:hypothetical protein
MAAARKISNGECVLSIFISPIIKGLAPFRDGIPPFRAYWLYSQFFIAYKLRHILQYTFLKYQIQDLRDRLLVKI